MIDRHTIAYLNLESNPASAFDIRRQHEANDRKRLGSWHSANAITVFWVFRSALPRLDELPICLKLFAFHRKHLVMRRTPFGLHVILVVAGTTRTRTKKIDWSLEWWLCYEWLTVFWSHQRLGHRPARRQTIWLAFWNDLISGCLRFILFVMIAVHFRGPLRGAMANRFAK